MYPFSCVLWAINSKQLLKVTGLNFSLRTLSIQNKKTLCLRVSVFDKILCVAPLMFGWATYMPIPTKNLLSHFRLTLIFGYKKWCKSRKCLIYTTCCGETGIRTLGTVTRSPHFECGPIDHSGISPIMTKALLEESRSALQGGETGFWTYNSNRLYFSYFLFNTSLR